MITCNHNYISYICRPCWNVLDQSWFRPVWCWDRSEPTAWFRAELRHFPAGQWVAMSTVCQSRPYKFCCKNYMPATHIFSMIYIPVSKQVRACDCLQSWRQRTGPFCRRPLTCSCSRVYDSRIQSLAWRTAAKLISTSKWRHTPRSWVPSVRVSDVTLRCDSYQYECVTSSDVVWPSRTWMVAGRLRSTSTQWVAWRMTLPLYEVVMTWKSFSIQTQSTHSSTVRWRHCRMIAHQIHKSVFN